MASNDMNVSQAATWKVIERYRGAGLRQVLASPDARARSKAAHGLALSPGEAIELALLGAASDDADHVRLWAAYSLAQIGTERSLETLKRLQNDRWINVRNMAAEAASTVQACLGGERRFTRAFESLALRLVGSAPECPPE